MSNGYKTISFSINKKKYTRKYHHIAWFLHYGKWPDIDIDHADRDRVNNKIINLRKNIGNIQYKNRPDRPVDLDYTNKSKYGKGIYYRKGRYEVYIVRRKKRYDLGVFYTHEDALKARDGLLERLEEDERRQTS